MSLGYVIFPFSAQSTKVNKEMVLSVPYRCVHFRPMEKLREN